MPSKLPPVQALVITRAPIVNKDRTASWDFLKILQGWSMQISNSLNQLGEFIGSISADAAISGRTGTIGTALQNLDGAGVLAAHALSGTIQSGSLPTPTITDIGGVQAVNPAVNQWVDSIGIDGTPHLSQPGFGNLGGTASAAQVPDLSALNGAVTAAQVPPLSGLNGRITEAQLPAAGLGGSVTLAALTVGGTEGSLTFTNGVITAVVNPT